MTAQKQMRTAESWREDKTLSSVEWVEAVQADARAQGMRDAANLIRTAPPYMRIGEIIGAIEEAANKLGKP